MLTRKKLVTCQIATQKQWKNTVLQRGVRGLEARQTTTAQYYRDFCTLHRREAHWRVAQGAVRQVVYNYTEKALYSFKTKKESNIRINLLSLNRKGIVKNWLGYLLSVSLSIIKMKDYEKVSVHIVFIGRYQ